MKKRLLSLVMALAMICGFAAWVPGFDINANAGATLVWPVPGTMSYKKVNNYHNGNAIDISGSDIAGYNVVAAMGGTVIAKFLCGSNHWDSPTGDGLHDTHTCHGFGNGIVIQGDDGRIYQYAHMQAGSIPSGVYNGAYVSAGQNIGKVGMTGYASGYHLHFGISKGEYWYASGINPYEETYVDGTKPEWSDKTPPTISNVRVYDADNNGYTVECTVTDEGGSGISHVSFPTWTLENDQDDIKWTDGTISGSTVTFRVNISDHNYEYGIYRTHIYAYDNAGNYSCTAVSDVSIGIGHEMSEDEAAGQTIPDGDYWIFSGVAQNDYLDIPGVDSPASNWTSLIVTEALQMPSKVDTWTVTYLNNGFYKITQNGEPVAMEVPYASLNHDSQVKVYEDNQSVAQQWSINETNNGYTIQSRANGYYLDLYGLVTGESGRVVTHELNGGNNQMWCFVPFNSDDRPVADGEYNIKSAAGNAYLDAEGSSYSSGTNIQVDSTASDTFVLKYISDGYYTILEKTTGLYLSVTDTGDSEYLKVNKNIQLTDYSEPCRNNLWRLVDKCDNQYYLISKYNGYYLDLAEMSTIAGTNVQSVQYNSSDTQKWMFVNPHAHSYTSKVTKKATCTKTGVRTYTCSCGDSYTKTIKALGHDYVETVVKPTCSSKGYTNHKCTRCGNEYNDTETDMIAHKFGKWTVTTKPTCTAKGIETRTCSVCKAKETRKTSALGHDYIESIIPPTCQSKGYTLHKCLRCNDEYKDNETNMAAHSFSKWTTTVKPTCTAKGSETRICSVCKVSETREIKALGHDYVASLVSANCNSKGYTLYKCSRCGDEIKDNYTEPTGNHRWSEWKTTAFDTDKNTSTQTRTCSVCNKTETKTTKNAIQRLAGAGRYETAVEISKAGFPDGSDTVVLAYGLNYADALAGVSLAKAMNAPILLTNLKTLPNETLVEIKRLDASNVIILGGTGAVGEEVEKILKENNLNVERIAGKTRFETATKIAQKMQKLNDNKAPKEVFFVYAFNSADALSVSAVAAVKGAPVIYLKTNGELDDATANYLKSVKGSVKNAYVIGGSGVISDDMMKKAGKALGVTPTRVFGKDRFATCVAVNEKFADVLDGDSICVATGMDFPDALAGGVYAAINKAPLFLVNGKLKTPKLTDEQKAYLKAKSAAKITAFGGVGVVPDNHIEDIAKNSV